jgi:hypothetical protein
MARRRRGTGRGPIPDRPEIDQGIRPAAANRVARGGRPFIDMKEQ